MKFAALLIVLFTIPAIAGAQAADCRSVANSTERLACYDKAQPPAAQQASRRSAAPKPASAEQQAPLGDVLAAENSKLDARIKGICRGC
jgi:predicted lipid-binding transport protein (Tim44 family)